MSKSMHNKSTKVFVGNIPYKATEQQLNEIFSKAGRCTFKLMLDKESGTPKGFGFCEFEDAATADSAIRNLNNFEIGGRVLRISAVGKKEDNDDGDGPHNRDFKHSNAAMVSTPVKEIVAATKDETLLHTLQEFQVFAKTYPEKARYLLIRNPALTHALQESLLKLTLIETETATGMELTAPPTPPPVFSQEMAQMIDHRSPRMEPQGVPPPRQHHPPAHHQQPPPQQQQQKQHHHQQHPQQQPPHQQQQQQHPPPHQLNKQHKPKPHHQQSKQHYQQQQQQQPPQGQPSYQQQHPPHHPGQKNFRGQHHRQNMNPHHQQQQQHHHQNQRPHHNQQGFDQRQGPGPNQPPPQEVENSEAHAQQELMAFVSSVSWEELRMQAENLSPPERDQLFNLKKLAEQQGRH